MPRGVLSSSLPDSLTRIHVGVRLHSPLFFVMIQCVIGEEGARTAPLRNLCGKRAGPCSGAAQCRPAGWMHPQGEQTYVNISPAQ